MENNKFTYKKINANNRSYYQKKFDWDIAKGLQKVDNLSTSSYLDSITEQYIQGNIKQDDVYNKINAYYKIKENRESLKNTLEADLVATNIEKLLSEANFNFSPVYLQNIHYDLFNNVFKYAVQIRKFNISKQEWILDGKSVIYAPYNHIKSTLDYDFSNYSNNDFCITNKEKFISNFTKFIADIWQVHPFEEGNTRTIAVFSVQLLKNFGYDVTNNLFTENSLYFRNCLVRANYYDLKNNISTDIKPLTNFFSILINDNKIDITRSNFSNRSLRVDNIKNSKHSIKASIQTTKSTTKSIPCKDAR